MCLETAKFAEETRQQKSKFFDINLLRKYIQTSPEAPAALINLEPAPVDSIAAVLMRITFNMPAEGAPAATAGTSDGGPPALVPTLAEPRPDQPPSDYMLHPCLLLLKSHN